MKETIIGIISLSAGSFLVVFFKFFARFVIEQQNQFWGFHFGARGIKATETISIIIGISFIIVGLLTLFQMIRFK
jgi:hypothetical protein